MASRLFIALRVPATPERTFEAFVYEIDRWWQPNGLFDFTVDRHGALRFEPGQAGRLVEAYDDGTEFEIGRITEWEPPHLLAFTWRQASFAPDQVTHVRVTFEPAGAETRVSVEHAGWDTVPQEHAARHGFPLEFFQQRHAEWWRLLLSRMRQRATDS